MISHVIRVGLILSSMFFMYRCGKGREKEVKESIGIKEKGQVPLVWTCEKNIGKINDERV